jgi:hypothetical protein
LAYRCENFTLNFLSLNDMFCCIEQSMTMWDWTLEKLAKRHHETTISLA